jgi:hypothetical protein
MIRVAQMLLHKALSLHLSSGGDEETPDLLPWFLDIKDVQRAPFSIYNFIRITGGLLEDGENPPSNFLQRKYPGDWFGPHSVTQTLIELCSQVPQIDSALAFYYGRDNVLYKQDLLELVRKSEGDPWDKACLLLFPLQLGMKTNMNMVYASSLRRYFKLPWNMGMIGGRPRLAHYFVGLSVEEDAFLFTDPHYVQAAARDLGTPERESFLNPHIVQTIPLSHLQPSNTLVFYVKDELEFEGLFAALDQIAKEDNFACLQVESTCSIRRFSEVDKYSTQEGEFELIND